MLLGCGRPRAERGQGARCVQRLWRPCAAHALSAATEGPGPTQIGGVEAGNGRAGEGFCGRGAEADGGGDIIAHGEPRHALVPPPPRLSAPKAYNRVSLCGDAGLWNPWQWADSQLAELKAHLEGLLEDRRAALQANIDALNDRVARLEAQFAEDKASTMAEIEARNRELTLKLEEFQACPLPPPVSGCISCAPARSVTR